MRGERAGDRRARAGVVALGLAAALSLLFAAQAAARVDADFFGVVPQGAMSNADFSRMEGVAGTLRIPVNWYEVEPEPGQFDFAALDRIVGEAADQGIRVLPFLFGTPTWISRDPAIPPLGSAAARAAWTDFVRKMVRRYGPRGQFWQGRAQRMPIRRWQIWNEPNFLLFWRPAPSPVGYIRLLRLAAGTIRRADPGARVIAAGLAPIEGGIAPWEFLRRMYLVPGARQAFDVAALHPYATSSRIVEEEIWQTRLVMAAGGDGRTPLQVTEVGIASDAGVRSPFVKGAKGQARFLRQTLGMLVAQRRRWRIAGVDWFAWRDGETPDPHCVFCEFAGLFDRKGRPKAAWWAFRRLSVRAQLSPSALLERRPWGS